MLTRQLGEVIARRLDSRYYEFHCTERTTSQELLYTFDQARRLQDVQMVEERPGDYSDYSRVVSGVPMADTRPRGLSRYIEPGVLWWAFDAESARRRGAGVDQVSQPQAIDPSEARNVTQERAVVAIHNLERPEPPVIEDLFTVLANRRFLVAELGVFIKAPEYDPPQIILGVERIRAVPKWIRQQCAVGRLQELSLAELARSAKLRVSEENRDMVDLVAEALQTDPASPTRFGAVDAATFEDLLRTVLTLHIKPGSPAWRVLLDIFGVE